MLKRVRELATAEMCPACGLRPIGVRRTGLCARCHLDGLRLVHEEEILKADAELARVAAKSKLYRRRQSLAEAEALASGGMGDAAFTMDDDTANDAGRAAADHSKSER